jgi:vacuolar-type H+-ATPase subunit I/STV1
MTRAERFGVLGVALFFVATVTGGPFWPPLLYALVAVMGAAFVVLLAVAIYHAVRWAWTGDPT